MIVYTAGPYRGDVLGNILQARKVAIELWEKGYTVICPHMNTAFFDFDCSVDNSVYLAGDLEILERCDAIVMLPNWEQSDGARAELDFAQRMNIPDYKYPNMPLLI